jgi:hypothetical protein
MKKKKIITNDKPSINHHHAPHHEEEGEAVLPMIWWNDRFDHEDILMRNNK